MSNVLARLNARLGDLNSRITATRQRVTSAESVLTSVEESVVKLERIRADVIDMKKKWIAAQRDDPFDEDIFND